MAGGTQFEVILGVDLDDSKALARLRAFQEQLAALEARARTPNTGAVASASSSSLATQTGRLQAQGAVLLQQAQASGAVSPGTMRLLQQTLGGTNVQDTITRALGLRPGGGRINIEEFSKNVASANSQLYTALQKQIQATLKAAAQQEADTAQQTKTAQAYARAKERADARAAADAANRGDAASGTLDRGLAQTRLARSNAVINNPVVNGVPLQTLLARAQNAAQYAGNLVGFQAVGMTTAEQKQAAAQYQAARAAQVGEIKTAALQETLANQELRTSVVTASAAYKELAASLQAQVLQTLRASPGGVAALAAANKERQLLGAQTQVAVTDSLTPAEVAILGAGRNARTNQDAAVAYQAAKAATEEETAARGDSAAAVRLQNALENRERDRVILGNEANVQALAEERVARIQRTEAEKRAAAKLQQQVFAQLKAQGAPTSVIGTPFQRLQAGIASRPDRFRDPTDFLTGPQFLKSRFLTTAGFAISGIATYAAFGGIAKAVGEANKLQITLSQIQAQFNSLGKGEQFAGFRSAIQDIAKKTGEAATEVALIAFQFRGAFKNLSTKEIENNIEAAVKISKVTGLSLKEVTDSLTAAALSYQIPVEKIGDVTLALQERTGVLAKETITAVADLAPVAKAAGLSFEEVASIAAVAQAKSGRSGAALAEGFNRILPSIQGASSEIIKFYQQINPAEADKVTQSLGQGKTGEVLKKLGADYKSFSLEQRNAIIDILGGRREAQNIIPVFEAYDEVIQNVQASQNSFGKTNEYFAKLQGTVGQALKVLAENAKAVITQLLRLGVADAFGLIIVSFTKLLDVTGRVLGFLADLNDTLGGIPGKMIGVALAIYTVVRALQALGQAQVFASLTTKLGATGGGASILNGLGFLGGTFRNGLGFLGGLFGRGAAGAAIPATGEALSASGLIVPAGAAGVQAGAAGAGLTGAASGIATVGAGALAIGGVVALTKYFQARNDASQNADRELRRLLEKDKGQIENLYREAQQNTDNWDKFGSWATGGKTQEEIALDALQVKTSEADDFKGKIDALKAIFKDREDVSKKLFEIGENLKENPTDDKAYNDARELVSGLEKLRGVRAETALVLARLFPKKEEGREAYAGQGPRQYIINTLKNGKEKSRQTGLGKTASSDDQFDLLIKTEIERFQANLATYNEFVKLGKDATAKQKEEVLSRVRANGTSIDLGPVRAKYGGDLKKLTSEALKQDLGLNLPAGITPEKYTQELQAVADEYRAKGTVAGISDSAVFADVTAALSVTGENAVETLDKYFSQLSLQDLLKEVGPDVDNLKNLSRKYARGEISSDTYLKELRKSYDIIQQKVKAAIAGGTLQSEEADKILQEQDEIEKQIAEAARSVVQRQLSTTELRVKLSGGTQGDIEVAKQTTILNALKNPDSQLSKDDKLDFANQYVESQRAYVEYLASLADTEEEANRILSQGVPIPQEVLAVINAEQVRAAGAEAQAQITQLGTLLGKTYDETVALIGAAIAAGATAQEAAVALARVELERVNQIIEQYAKAATFGNAGFDDNARKAYRDLLEKQKALFSIIADGASALSGVESVDSQNRISPKQTKEDAKKKADEARRKAQELELSRLAIAKAQANGDPFQLAYLAMQEADINYRYAEDDAARNNAIAQRIEAENSYRKAVAERSKAYISVLKALADGDPVKEAELSLQEAQIEFENASSDAERMNAYAAAIQAQNAKRDALNAAADAQKNLFIAIAQARGDVIEAAKLQLQLAEEQYNRLIAQGADVNSARARDAQAQAVQARAALRDTVLQQQEEDIQFDLDMGRISTAEAIARLENLLMTAETTEAQRREIQRQIKGLKDQLAKDLQFNIPDIVMPTLYQVRRERQQGLDSLAPNAFGNYNDNRNIVITFTGVYASPDEITKLVTDALSRPPTFGAGNRLY